MESAAQQMGRRVMLDSERKADIRLGRCDIVPVHMCMDLTTVSPLPITDHFLLVQNFTSNVFLYTIVLVLCIIRLVRLKFMIRYLLFYYSQYNNC